MPKLYPWEPYTPVDAVGNLASQEAVEFFNLLIDGLGGGGNNIAIDSAAKVEALIVLSGLPALSEDLGTGFDIITNNQTVLGAFGDLDTFTWNLSVNFGNLITLTGLPIDSLDFGTGFAVIRNNATLLEALQDLDAASNSGPTGVTRVTANTTITNAFRQWNGNTDAGGITLTLPVGVQGEEYKMVNTGTSGNTLTIAPDGTEDLLGVNSNFTLNDAESLLVAYDATDGWY